MRSITLDYIPPGANQLHRMHHYERSRWRRQVHDDVSLLLVEAGAIGATPYERAIVTVEFRWRDRRKHDVDNALAGMKAGLDSLSGRWIIDDDTEHARIIPLGVTGTGEPDRVVITVTEDDWRTRAFEQRMEDS